MLICNRDNIAASKGDCKPTLHGGMDATDEIQRDYLQAVHGWELVHEMKRAYGLDVQTCWVLLPSQDRRLNDLAMGEALCEFLKEKYYQNALVISCDSCDEGMRSEMRGDCRVIFRSLAPDDLEAILAYYRLVQFASDVIVVSLEEPYSCAAWLGHFGIDLESFVRDGIFHGRPVNWMWWNVDGEAIARVVREHARLLANRHVILYGKTRSAIDIVQMLREQGIEPQCVLDSNSEKEGFDARLALPCFLPERALVPYDDAALIVVPSKYAREMRGRLSELGYHGNQVLEVPVAGDSSSVQDDGIETLDREFAIARKGYRARMRIGGGKLIMSIGGTGDVYWLCSLLPGYLRNSGIDEYTLLFEERPSSKADAEIAALFGIDAPKTCSIQELMALYKAWEFFGGERLDMKPDLHLGSRLIKSIQPPKQDGHYPEWRNHLACMRYQYFVYPGSQELAQLEKRPIDERTFAQQGLRRGCTVMLSPYSNAFRSSLLGTGFWPKLAAALSDRGYDVCANCSDAASAVEGTVPMFLPYNEMVGFLDYAGGFVASRSGLCDIVSSASACAMVLLYDKGVGVIPDTFSLRRMGLQPSSSDFVFEGDVDALLGKVLEKYPVLSEASQGLETTGGAAR